MRAVEGHGECDATASLIAWKVSRDRSEHFEAHQYALDGLVSNKANQKLQLAYFTSLMDLGQQHHAISFADRTLRNDKQNRRLAEAADRVRIALESNKTIR